MVKTCSKCGETKSVSEFNRHKKSKDKLAYLCKTCAQMAVRAWEKANPEKVRASRKLWRDANPDKVKASRKAWRDTNQGKVRASRKAWKLSHPDRVKADREAWKKANPDKQKAARIRYNTKINNTATGRTNGRISHAIYKALKKSKAGRRWESLVGFTVNELKAHLEKKFKKGMSWENMGKWHLDHIIPRSAFNYSSPDDLDFKRCWCLKNLQPMWGVDNVKKSNKLDKPFQPALELQIKKGPLE